MATEIGTKGKVVQVLGAVVDVEFPPDKVPEIYNEVRVRVANPTRISFLKLSNCWVTTGYAAWLWAQPMACSAA